VDSEENLLKLESKHNSCILCKTIKFSNIDKYCDEYLIELQKLENWYQLNLYLIESILRKYKLTSDPSKSIY
jgi:hypothetical protein